MLFCLLSQEFEFYDLLNSILLVELLLSMADSNNRRTSKFLD